MAKVVDALGSKLGKVRSAAADWPPGRGDAKAPNQSKLQVGRLAWVGANRTVNPASETLGVQISPCPPKFMECVAELIIRSGTAYPVQVVQPAPLGSGRNPVALHQIGLLLQPEMSLSRGTQERAALG